MAALHKPRVQMTVSGTPGTGTITLNAASSGYQTFAAAYAANATVDILITDGTAWEVARNCTYTNAGTTVTRGTLEASSTGSAISLTSAAIVSVILTAQRGNDIENLLGVFGLAEIAVTGAVTATLGAMHLCTGTSADYTVTLPAASGNTGKMLGFRMGTTAALTKLVTLDGNASETIDGSLTRVMWAYETAILLCDGSNWFKIAGKTIPMQCTMHLGTVQTGVVTATVSKCNIDTTDSDNTGLMADTTNKKIIIKRASKYLCTAEIVFDLSNLASTRNLTILQKNSSQIATAEGDAAAGTFPAPWLAAQTDVVVADYLEIYGYHIKGTNASFTGGTLASGPCQLNVLEIPAW